MIERFKPFWQRVIAGVTILMLVGLLACFVPANPPLGPRVEVFMAVSFALVLVLAMFLLWPKSR